MITLVNYTCKSFIKLTPGKNSGGKNSNVWHKLDWIILKKGFSVYGSYVAAYWFIEVSAFLPVPPALVLSSLIGNIWKIRIVSQSITIIRPLTSKTFPVILWSGDRESQVIIMCCVE